MLCPGVARRVREDDGAPLTLCCLVEGYLERSANRNGDASACLRLPQANPGSVISGPRQPQEVTLALPGPYRQEERQMHVCRRLLEKCGFILQRPDCVSPGAGIEPSALFAWVDRYFAAVLANRQDAREDNPCVVG